MANITLPKLPKVDLPKVDLPKFEIPKVNFPKIDLPKIPALHSIDLTNVDLRKNVESVLANPAVKQARDAGYTAVGFLVLGVQKLQVRRRELISGLAARRNTAQ